MKLAISDFHDVLLCVVDFFFILIKWTNIKLLGEFQILPKMRKKINVFLIKF